ncbi:Uncharacterised protein [Escherichia coli]|uniref:Uncharacterized protein n=1 Tax=Escherichia coli TaxID=562 RepID=A0A376TFS2_ECOLX|nr:Uncharacterised protein [Escherichia coli]
MTFFTTPVTDGYSGSASSPVSAEKYGCFPDRALRPAGSGMHHSVPAFESGKSSPLPEEVFVSPLKVFPVTVAMAVRRIFKPIAFQWRFPLNQPGSHFPVRDVFITGLMILILTCQSTIENETTCACEAPHFTLLLTTGLNWNLNAYSRFTGQMILWSMNKEPISGVEGIVFS